MTGYHTRWVRPPEHAEDPERIAIREALAFGKAVYDQRRALDLSLAELAGRADMTVDEIECIEEGGTEPTIALLRRLAAWTRRVPDRRTRPRLGTVRTPRSLTRPAQPSPARNGYHHTATDRGIPGIQYPPIGAHTSPVWIKTGQVPIWSLCGPKAKMISDHLDNADEWTLRRVMQKVSGRRQAGTGYGGIGRRPLLRGVADGGIWSGR